MYTIDKTQTLRFRGRSSITSRYKLTHLHFGDFILLYKRLHSKGREESMRPMSTNLGIDFRNRIRFWHRAQKFCEIVSYIRISMQLQRYFDKPKCVCFYWHK